MMGLLCLAGTTAFQYLPASDLGSVFTLRRLEGLQGYARYQTGPVALVS